MDQMTVYLILAGVFGLFMAWGIGANDVANAMATSVGSKAITIKKAIVIAAIFEFSGAVLAGGGVTKTIRKGIVDLSYFESCPELLVFGMLAALLAAGIWLLVATRVGWPVSTTHSIVGAIVGFAVVGVGTSSVSWGKIGIIVATWVISPLMSGVIAFFIFKSVQKLILNTENPIENSKKYAPVYAFITGFFLALVTLFKGLKHIFKGLKADADIPSVIKSVVFVENEKGMLQIPWYNNVILAIICGLIVAVIAVSVIKKIHIKPEDDKRFYFTNVERIFAVLMVITACAMAFAHGSNDVANAIGPVAAIFSYVDSAGELTKTSSVPAWILLLGGGGIVLGLATLGYKVIATVGKNITELTPSRGFSCELAAATTIVIASGTGIPISTTHTLVGAVLGVGLARGIGALNLGMIGRIFVSWIVTLPAGAILSILFFFMFKGMFS